mmetsp:Transcript_8692/g.14434  ORF Transcript_8692/g.14434 Transcript_8692/m.14434 type:complete len:271 (+) Transcript_8692:46-858(+)
MSLQEYICSDRVVHGVITSVGRKFSFIRETTSGASQTIFLHHTQWIDRTAPTVNASISFNLDRNSQGLCAMMCCFSRNRNVLVPSTVNSAVQESPRREQEQEQDPSSLFESCAPILELNEEQLAFVSSHRRKLRSEACFICLDDSKSPSVGMLCCGQPTHLSCMQEWIQTSAPTSDMNCPYCRTRLDENPSNRSSRMRHSAYLSLSARAEARSLRDGRARYTGNVPAGRRRWIDPRLSLSGEARSATATISSPTSTSIPATTTTTTTTTP